MTKIKLFFIAILLGISTFTHLYRIDKTFVFNNDEGRDALVAYRMIETKLPVLLGPETSVGNMYLGPFYYYLMVLPLILSGLNPVGPAIMVGLLGIFSTYLIFLLGKRYFGFKAGFLAGLFYAVIPIMVFGSRSSWNPNVIPFFVALLMLLYPAKQKIHSLFIGILTGIIFQLHYVALVFPAVLLLRDFYLAWRGHHWRPFLVHAGLVLVGFLVATLPFWIFELRHNFINMQAFINYLASKSSGVETAYPPYLQRVFANFQFLISGMLGSVSLAFTPISTLTWVSGSLMLLFYLLFEKGLLSYLLLISILAVSVLKESVHIHYISFLYPVITLMLGRALTLKWPLKLSALVLVISLLMPGYVSLKYHLFEVTSTQTIRAKDTADYIVRESSGRPYNVVNATTSSTTTILYYLAISENPPQLDDQELLFVICEGKLCEESILTRTDLFVNGPAHPTLINYLGYTPSLSANEGRTLLKNEWVTYDVHVATIKRGD